MEGNKFVVFGVGRYGRQIALKLAKKGAEVYCFDFSEDKIEGLKDDVALAVTMDCTLKKNLLSQSIEDVDAAVIAIGENFEATILTCVHLIDMGIKRIIARASGEQQRTILEKIGVTDQTYYSWRKDYVSLRLDCANRLKEVEKDNTRLR